MRINVIEKFGLYERLLDLSKGLNEHEESQTICNKAIHDLKSGFTSSKFNLYLEQLKQFDWIVEVENFLDGVNSFINENKYGLELERILEKLDGINTYAPIVESIKGLVALDESEIKSNIPSLVKFRFEPNVKRLVNEFEQSEFNVQTNEKATITSAPITPVMQVEEGFVFSSNSGNYMVSGDLTKIDKFNGKVTNEFATAKEALNMFKFKGNNTFEANLPKANMKIVTSEEGTKMTINESEIVNKSQLTKVLKNAGFVNYTDTKTRSLVEFMYENANKLVEIDFVKSVETINENFEVFKMANNEVSIAKFDKRTRGFVLEALDVEDLEDLSESLNKNYDLDFNNVLEGLHINIASMEFKSLVENIDISRLTDMTKSDEINYQIDEAVSKYNELNVENRANVEKEFSILSEMESVVKSEEVMFLVETKKALVEKLDEGEELTKSLEMLNEELTSLVIFEAKTSSGEDIAKKMKASKASFGPSLISKVSKMDSVSKADLEELVPDFIAGKDIASLFESGTISGASIASKMKASKVLKDFDKVIAKVEKMDKITEKELDEMLPDYIAGKDIAVIFK